MKKTLAVLGVSLLTACASTPVDLATAPHVPPDRILASEYFEAGDGKVPVTVSFDRLNDIGTMTFSVSVDGNRVASLKPGEKVEFYVPEGRRVITSYLGTKPNNAMTSTLPDYFQRGTAYTYRISQGADGGVTLLAQ
jgi:hypothetical protein